MHIKLGKSLLIHYFNFKLGKKHLFYFNCKVNIKLILKGVKKTFNNVKLLS